MNKTTSVRLFRRSNPTVTRNRLWRMGLAVVVMLTFVQLAAGQERFRQRNYRVRVSVVRDARQVALQPRGAYQVIGYDGKPLTELAAGKVYFTQIQQGKPGDRIYRLVLSEMGPEAVDEAIALAKAARDAYGESVKVLRTRASSGDESRILVTLGQFDTIDGARDYMRQMRNKSIKFIYEDHSRMPTGEVRLLDADGNLIARDSRILRIVPYNETQDSVHVLEIEEGKWNQAQLRESRHYRGELELTLDDDGLLAVINDLWVEYYLYSVVPVEIGTDAPEESLKAQAVAGRSEAVAKIQRGMIVSQLYDFYDTSIAQAYRGKGVEVAEISQAVDLTRGEILVHDGQAVDAVYSHSCGGFLANSRDIWPQGGVETFTQRKLDELTGADPPALRNHLETYDWLGEEHESLCRPDQRGFPRYARQYYRWEKTLDLDDLNRLMASYGVGTVHDVKIEKRSASGRVQAIEVIGSRKTVEITGELTIRRALGGIYSTLFVILPAKEGDSGQIQRLEIEGGGFGHGVGMCQMGCYMMGRMGYNYRQILGHYFHDVKIRRLYR